jgi:hypothetical protein
MFALRSGKKGLPITCVKLPLSINAPAFKPLSTVQTLMGKNRSGQGQQPKSGEVTGFVDRLLTERH